MSAFVVDTSEIQLILTAAITLKVWAPARPDIAALRAATPLDRTPFFPAIPITIQNATDFAKILLAENIRCELHRLHRTRQTRHHRQGARRRRPRPGHRLAAEVDALSCRHLHLSPPDITRVPASLMLNGVGRSSRPADPSRGRENFRLCRESGHCMVRGADTVACPVARQDFIAQRTTAAGILNGCPSHW